MLSRRDLSRRRSASGPAGRRRRGLGLLAVAVVILALAAGALALGSVRGGRAAEPQPAGAALRVGGGSSSFAAVATPAVGPPQAPLTPGSGPDYAIRFVPASERARIHFKHPPLAALLFDLGSGRVLWRWHAERIVPIASLTKMMTALLVVEHSQPYERVKVTKQALAYQGSGIGVLPKHKSVRLETMLTGLLLPSGNDAAIALAQHVAGTVPRFVAMMNAKADELHLRCTRFSSPSGFVDAGNHSCVSDLALLARDMLRNPRLRHIVGLSKAVLPFPIKGGKLYLYNNNTLMQMGYRGVTGVKTGYTNAAGHCLVATATRHGVRLGIVLLHSPDTADQGSRLLDAGFQAMRR